ncbi:formylglycine-generating enzyme family protein [uncultured Fibrella sp.]|uniref:formylglycine-generating enzyme family protein n=1 Tax=uncultured Fibrella sp. TaxID=1284596 RepID=UPI0035C990F5
MLIRLLIQASVGVMALAGFSACQQKKPDHAQADTAQTADTAITSCHTNPPSRFASGTSAQAMPPGKSGNRTGMVAIPAGTFLMGADNDQARPDEYPKHSVCLDGFWMDATEVTNAQFARFVKATGYITTAERKPDWEEMRKQLPPGTPKPADNLLVASSLVFSAPAQISSLADYSQWWQWVAGADWRHPEGPGSSIVGKENYPVVQVSWDDARAYANWAGKRLPTEAEWEWAARGGLRKAIYPWGNEPVDAGKPKANSWQGTFPVTNTKRDGFDQSAPVKSFIPNGYGLYDMAGNVWEWCSDYYRPDYYQTQARAGVVKNPTGPLQSVDPDEPTVPKRVQRGGSFLCNDSYCSSYRSSARMKSSPDTGLSHTGFRCVMN